MRRSEASLFWKRCSVNSRRTLSTSARSSGVPRSGSNSQTARPRKLLDVFRDALSPSATLSFHMVPNNVYLRLRMENCRVRARERATNLAGPVCHAGSLYIEGTPPVLFIEGAAAGPVPKATGTHCCPTVFLASVKTPTRPLSLLQSLYTCLSGCRSTLHKTYPELSCCYHVYRLK